VEGRGGEKGGPGEKERGRGRMRLQKRRWEAEGRRGGRE